MSRLLVWSWTVLALRESLLNIGESVLVLIVQPQECCAR